MSAPGSDENYKPESVQQALRDIALIRRCIEQRNTGSEAQIPTPPHRLQRFLHIVLLVLSSAILLFELVSDGAHTQLLLMSRTDLQVRAMGLMNLALFLLVLCFIFYFFVSQSAKGSHISREEFVARHFSYLSNLALFTDLFMKFVIFSLLVLAARPEWIAPLLFLFIGDYLMQGRLFVFSLRSGLLLGACSVGLGFICFVTGTPDLVWPLVGFITVTTLSLIKLLSQDRPAHAVTGAE